MRLGGARRLATPVFEKQCFYDDVMVGMSNLPRPKITPRLFAHSTEPGRRRQCLERQHRIVALVVAMILLDEVTQTRNDAMLRAFPKSPGSPVG
jgi:hypothetical protein